MMQFNTKLYARFNNVSQFNSQFSKAKVYIAYHGDNRNYTSISKDTFQDMVSSLYGVPVVGEWIEKLDDEDGGSFGSHGGKIEISEDGVKYVQTTKPIGFVGQDADVYWETVTEEDGQEHEYLVASPIYLWSGRYPEAETIIKNQNAQSMEINVLDASLRDDDFYEINKAEFSALCVLGTIEPCFESSAFKQFNLNKDEFKQEFNLMIKELKQSLFEGGDKVREEFQEVVTEIAEEAIGEDVIEEITEKEVMENIIEDNLEQIDEEFEEATIGDETIVEPAKEVEEYFESKYNEILGKFNELESNYKSLEEEIVTLREFKELKDKEEFEVEQLRIREEKIDHINNEYSHISQDIKDLFISKVDEYNNTDDIDADMCIYIVKNKVVFSKTKQENATVKLSLDEDSKKTILSPYGDLF